MNQLSEEQQQQLAAIRQRWKLTPYRPPFKTCKDDIEFLLGLPDIQSAQCEQLEGNQMRAMDLQTDAINSFRALAVDLCKKRLSDTKRCQMWVSRTIKPPDDWLPHQSR